MGFMQTKPLKGPEKICRPHCFFGLPLKGFLLCLGILAPRKGVYQFLDAYSVGYLIFLQLILYVCFNRFFISSCCVHILAQKCLFPYLCFNFAWRSNIISCFSLSDTHNLRYTILGRDTDAHMDMIRTRIRFYDLYPFLPA